jgi:DNA ligase (NAD+)
MDKINHLVEQIKLAQNAYYNGSAIIDDDEYDALVYELESLDPNNALLKRVGAEPTTEWKKEKHLTTLGSLLKVNTPEELKSWADTTFSKSFVVAEKLDGLSIGCQYENGKLKKAILRGNGLEGENILKNVLKMHNVIKTFGNFTGTLRGEIILTKDNHKKYFPEYSNPRNAASGICRTLEGDNPKHLSLIFYQVIGDDNISSEEEQLKLIKSFGGQTPNYYVCDSINSIKEIWEKYQNGQRDSLNYEIDGLVVSVNDLKTQQSLGEVNLRPKGKRAFKFANQFVKTTITDVTWATGNSGRITPICWFDTVNLLGSNVSKASVYNIAYIQKLGIDVGAEILVCKANEIIPRVEKVVKSTGSVTKTPDFCPDCGGKTEMQGENLVCTNTTNCSAQICGRIKNWVSELNLLEWGDNLLERLVQSGKVKNIAQLYSLTIDDLSNIDRMGKKSATKCYNVLHSNKSISLDLFIGALSIPMIGQSTVKLIMSAGYDNLTQLMTLTIENLEKVPGVGPVRAKSLVDGLKANQQLITDILNSGVQIKEKVVGKLTGYKIAITGSTNTKRSDLEKFIADNGGEYKSSVSKTCTHLVIADTNSTSSKAVNARSLGIKLINEESLLNLSI